jgi:hypothetical protein
VARTLADLIRTVSRNTGDLYEGTLTGATSPNTLLDSGHTEGDGWWTGGNLAIITAANPLNVGVERKITSWTQAGGAYTTNAFPVTPSAGDTYEVRRRPKHTRVSVKEFLNQGVREIDRQSWVHLDSLTTSSGGTSGNIVIGGLGGGLLVTQGYTGSASTLYHYGQQWYSVPTQFEFVHRVLYQDIVDPFGYLPWVELDQDKWETNGDGGILIQPIADYTDWDRSTITVPDLAPLRFLGSSRPTEFVLESDVNVFEGNYLEVFASARLCLRLAEGAQDEADFQAKFKMFYQLESDSFRGTRRGLPSGSRKVR